MIEALDGQKRIISEVIRHPQYYSGGLHNDVAILKWNDPLRLNDQVNVIQMIDETEQFASLHNCSLVSFQVTEDTFGKFLLILITILSSNFNLKHDLYFSALIQEKEEAQLLENPLCELRIRRSKWGNRFRLHENSTCIETSFWSSCDSDSDNPRDGHPLVCHNRFRRDPILVGILSWYNCQKAHPDVLFDIRSGMEWSYRRNEDLLYFH